ncbi:MAG: zinc metalloprotease HtpX [Candidatus Auribacterota bacterium]
MNFMKTVFLLGLLTVLLVMLGGYIGGSQGAMFFFLIALALNFSSYWWSDKIVLTMYRAQPVSESDAPELYSIVRELAQRANLPMPRVYIVPESRPNAFATGRNPKHAVVAVTEGIMRLLNKEELSGVIAHELSHIKNRDILIGSVAATIAGAIAMLANMLRWSFMFVGSGRRRDDNALGLLVLSILAPIAALIIQMAVSRAREFQADAGAASITGSPDGLASALRKLESSVRRNPVVGGSPATAHMFIVNPFKKDFFTSLFSTHPSTEQRIERLMSLR